MLEEILDNKLSEIQKAGLFRELRLIDSAPSAKVMHNGKEYINFSSNNYLGLAGDSEINKAAAEAIEKYGFGGTSSRLVGGYLKPHKDLETALAEFKNKEAALVFPSGYQTNLGVLSALGNIENTCIIMDKLNHASLWDGAKLSGARIFVYDHCDMNSLEKVLKRTRDYKLKIAVTESVFSMDGDIAPLKEFIDLCIKYGAASIIDEAHSTGLFGKEGRGLTDELGISDKVDIIIGTLSKAFGVQGGFVCSSLKFIDYLINKSRAFIYTTAVSPAICAAALKSLEIIKRSDDKREHLHNISNTLRTKLAEKGYTSNSKSQIIPVIIGDIENTAKISQKLLENGIYAPAIRFPTVAKNSARIRISLIATHQKEDIEKLLEIIG